MSPEDEELSLAQLDYAVTPLHVLALSELNPTAFGTLRGIDAPTFRSNLDLLARLVPPSCTTAADAHAFLAPHVRQAGQALPALENLCEGYESDYGTPFPLVGKAGMLALTRRARQRRAGPGFTQNPEQN